MMGTLEDEIREGIAKLCYQNAVEVMKDQRTYLKPLTWEELLDFQHEFYYVQADQILSYLRLKGWRQVDPEKSFEIDVSLLTSEMLGRYILSKLETSKALVVPIEEAKDEH